MITLSRKVSGKKESTSIWNWRKYLNKIDGIDAKVFKCVENWEHKYLKLTQVSKIDGRPTRVIQLLEWPNKPR